MQRLLTLNQGVQCGSDGSKNVGDPTGASPTVSLCVRGVLQDPEDDLADVSNPKRTVFLRDLAQVAFDEDLPLVYRCMRVCI